MLTQILTKKAIFHKKNTYYKYESNKRHFSMTVDLKFSSNPFQSNNNPSDEKIKEMKKAQEEKRAEYASILDEYRERYDVAKKDFSQAQSIFLAKQRELARHNENEKDYDTLKQDFLSSKKTFQNSRSEKDLRLQLLQYRTDNYVKANRLNLLDLA